MIPEIPRLDLRVHFIDGTSLEYEQGDAKLAQETLKRMTPSSLFTRPWVIIAGDYHTTTLTTSSVAAVDLLFSGDVKWSFGPNLDSITVVTEKEFQERVRYGTQDDSLRRDQMRPEGEPFVGFDHLRCLGGSNIYLEVRGVTRPRAVQSRAMTRFFEAPCILARLEEGGFKVINPHSITSVAFYPGSPESPSETWFAHRKPHEA